MSINISSNAIPDYINALNVKHSGFGVIKLAFKRLLTSVDIVGRNKREESGRLDRKAFTRFACGEQSIFSRRDVKEAVKSSVSVLIDVSFSTVADNVIQNLQNIAINLAKILEECGVDYEINAFNGESDVEHNGVQYQDINYYQVKPYNKPLRACIPALGSITLLGGDGTPDYSAIQFTIEELSTRHDDRKVLILLTDADAYRESHIKLLDALAKRLNIVLIAIGVGNTRVEQVFTHAVNIKDTNDLFSGSFSKILNTLSREV